MPVRLQRGLIILFALIAIGVSMNFVLRRDSLVTNTPLIDDTFMYFAIADNIADGNGISDDGENLTNGFQPLYVVLITPLFMLFDDPLLVIRFVVLLNIGLYVATALLLRHFMRRVYGSDGKYPLLANAVAIAFLAAPLVMEVYIRSMETGLLLFFYALLGAVYLRFDGIRTGRQAVIFGVLLGGAILTRIDAGLFAVSFAGVYLLLPRNRQGIWQALRQVMIVAVSALIVTSPWWMYNNTVFGDVMPTSGRALSLSLTEPYGGHPLWYPSYFGGRVEWMLHAVADNLMPLNLLWIQEHITLERVMRFGLAAVVIAVAVIGYRQWRSRITMSSTQHRAFEFLVMFVIALAGLAVYYTLTSAASWFYPRYMNPMLLLLFVLVIYFAAAGVRHMLGDRVLLALTGLFVMYAVLVVVADYRGTYYSYRGSYANQLEMINRHVPRDAKAGSIESGYVMYFRDNVYNLDGKTNAAAADALFDGDLLTYLRDENINYVVIFHWSERFATDPEADGWQLVESTIQWDVWKRVPPASNDTGS